MTDSRDVSFWAILIALILVATGIVVFLLESEETNAGQTASGGGCLEPDIMGNLWDDREVNANDAMYLLQEIAGFPLPRSIGGCGPHDIDCDADVDAADALVILRHVAGLPYSQTAGCPEVGAEV